MRQTQPSLDLLIALDALLEECSVSGAALRLGLSEPAMSRALGRIRQAMGDPVLVRSGQRMVPTPRALAVRAEVRGLVEGARRVFTPAVFEPATLRRDFVVLLSDAVATTVCAPLLACVGAAAPGIRLRFVPEGHGDQRALREGTADLEIAVISDPSPETRVEPLVDDHGVGVVRPGHRLLGSPVTPERFAAAEHVVSSRRGRTAGPVDAALAERGLRRRIVGSVPTFTAVLLAVRGSDLVGMAPARMSAPMIDALGLVTFPIPLDLPEMAVSQAWHRRHDADPAHAWLRGQVRALFPQGEVLTSGRDG
ncbi:LysR family transcriptional regulator [Streptosporangium jomthongense]|uniref:LysR family transcriptional regulator n=1 Tax=Streptosporangium jomthongense TaxID=1193683 RepID=A0ABV8FFS8_9ACTN